MRQARALLVVATAFLALPPIAGAQGLGDASKKEKERRESSKAPKAKTFTQDELDAAEKALEDLLEQARRASVPPGWLR
jgi:hypothetical protein